MTPQHPLSHRPEQQQEHDLDEWMKRGCPPIPASVLDRNGNNNESWTHSILGSNDYFRMWRQINENRLDRSHDNGTSLYYFAPNDFPDKSVGELAKEMGLMMDQQRQQFDEKSANVTAQLLLSKSANQQQQQQQQPILPLQKHKNCKHDFGNGNDNDSTTSNSDSDSETIFMMEDSVSHADVKKSDMRQRLATTDCACDLQSLTTTEVHGKEQITSPMKIKDEIFDNDDEEGSYDYNSMPLRDENDTNALDDGVTKVKDQTGHLKEPQQEDSSISPFSDELTEGLDGNDTSNYSSFSGQFSNRASPRQTAAIIAERGGSTTATERPMLSLSANQNYDKLQRKSGHRLEESPSPIIAVPEMKRKNPFPCTPKQQLKRLTQTTLTTVFHQRPKQQLQFAQQKSFKKEPRQS